jgi:hypothetical protein
VKTFAEQMEAVVSPQQLGSIVGRITQRFNARVTSLTR